MIWRRWRRRERVRRKVSLLINGNKRLIDQSVLCRVRNEFTEKAFHGFTFFFFFFSQHNWKTFCNCFIFIKAINLMMISPEVFLFHLVRQFVLAARCFAFWVNSNILTAMSDEEKSRRDSYSFHYLSEIIIRLTWRISISTRLATHSAKASLYNLHFNSIIHAFLCKLHRMSMSTLNYTR